MMVWNSVNDSLCKKTYLVPFKYMHDLYINTCHTESDNYCCRKTYKQNKKVYYCKFPKYSDTQKICCNHSKIWTLWLYHRVMSPNDADGMANSVDPDQTAPLGAVWSGSALFAQAYLSKNLGSLRYFDLMLLPRLKLVLSAEWLAFIWATSPENMSSLVCDQVRLKPACSATEIS